MELSDLDLLLIRWSILGNCAAHHYVLDSSSLRASSLLRSSSYIFICSPYLTINLSNLFSIIDFWYPIIRDECAVCFPSPHLSRGRCGTRYHHNLLQSFWQDRRLTRLLHMHHLLPTQHVFHDHASLYPFTQRRQCPYIPCTYLLYSLWVFMSSI